jgi:hypothetical protein
MPVLQIVKKYNNKSPLNGIVISDKVELATKDDLTGFILGVHRASRTGELDWDLIDFNWAISDKPNIEVLENPASGKTGKLA